MMGEGRLLSWGAGLLLALGCATSGAESVGGERQRALNSLLTAESEISTDPRSDEMRRLARREYEAGAQALGRGDPVLARHLFDRAAADAELSLALARRQAWSHQADERTATLERLRARPTLPAEPVTPQTGESP
jgi:hypothetical protein